MKKYHVIHTDDGRLIITDSKDLKKVVRKAKKSGVELEGKFDDLDIEELEVDDYILVDLGISFSAENG